MIDQILFGQIGYSIVYAIYLRFNDSHQNKAMAFIMVMLQITVASISWLLVLLYAPLQGNGYIALPWVKVNSVLILTQSIFLQVYIQRKNQISKEAMINAIALAQYNNEHARTLDKSATSKMAQNSRSIEFMSFDKTKINQDFSEVIAKEELPVGVTV